MHLGVVGHDGVCQVLQHHRFAGLRLGHQQGTLAFADGRHQVDDAAADVLVGLDIALELELLFREQRRQVLEHDLVFALLGRGPVHAVDLDQREVAFTVLGHAHLAFDQVAGVQVKTPDLARRQVDVVGAGHVAGVDGSQEAKTVGQHLEHAVAEDLLTPAGAFFHDREHQLLLAQAGDVLDLQRFAHGDELGNVLGLQFGQMHGVSTLWKMQWDGRVARMGWSEKSRAFAADFVAGFVAG